MLEPIFFQPNYKKVVWGGNNINSFFHRNLDEPDNIGESWEISAHKDGISKIINNCYNNQNLYELFNDKTKRKEIFGNKCLNMDKFPVLAKFIDADKSLSIQVHPDDEYAKIHENDNGKNEVWYIMDCKDDAKIIYGFKDEIKEKNLDNLLKNIENNVKYINVKRGDFISIPAGTIHAICGGITLCEVQQSSDVTYRVYDWNRLGLDGKPRQLHKNKALDVIKMDSCESIYNYYKFNENKNIYNSKNFNIDLINVKESLALESDENSFIVYIMLDGNGSIKTEKFGKNIEKGSCFLIPAELGEYTLYGNLRLLKVYI